MTVSIGIVTPSFNQGAFIQKTLESVVYQSYACTQYWVIDGQSTDNTCAILSQYAEKGVKFLTETDKGQADAINKGIELLDTEILAWLNSDDVYCPGSLQFVANYFEQHPDCDILYGQAYHIDAEDNFINYYPTRAFNKKKLKRSCFLAQPAVFFRKKVWQDLGGLDISLHYCLDYDFWLRAALQNKKFHYVQQYLAATRLYSQTKTATGLTQARAETLGMLKKHFGHCHARWYLSMSLAYERQFYPEASGLKKCFLLVSRALRESIKDRGFLCGPLALLFQGVPAWFFYKRGMKKLK